MEVGPPHAPIIIRERITWDESQGLVRFTMIDDPHKSGMVDNIISEKDGQLYLTFTFDWQFNETAPQQAIDTMRETLKKLAEPEGPIQKTINVVEGSGK